MDQDTINAHIEAFLKSLQELKVSEKTIQYIRSHRKLTQVKSKDTLILPGEICKHIYVVLVGGFVCRYVHPKSGEAKTINFYLDDLHPVMACLDSYFTQTPTNCELKAIADSVVIAMPK
ncbi:MAG: hypothetical protein AAFV25_14460, partial [Bacteroidota bacterium]